MRTSPLLLQNTPLQIRNQDIGVTLRQDPEGTVITELTDAAGRNLLRRATLIWSIEMIDRGPAARPYRRAA